MNLLQNKMNLTQQKDKIKLLGKSELTKKIQWLIELAGTDEVIDVIIDNFCYKTKVNQIRNLKKIPDDSTTHKNSIIYKSEKGDVGHWVYKNNKGIIYNSYHLKHQKQGSNQFCQSFAIIYMLYNCCSKLKIFMNNLKPGMDDYGNNIRVVVDFWRYLFNYDDLLREWLINEVRNINQEFINNNDDCLIAKNSDDIDINYIESKLLDIDIYAEQIAKNT